MPPKALIVFTRYPEPGKAKTRLIPALGPEGAASVHRQLTEHTLATIKQLQKQLQGSDSLSVTICYTGGELSLMANWLGPDWVYELQHEGDLGDRMVAACQTAFSRGSSGTVIIGTDCPELSVQHLLTALAALDHQDVVLGPAVDGGYYLVGLRQLEPRLFQGITWSTAQVFQQTLTIAESLNLTVTHLPMLQDIDHPADLKIWENTVSNQLGVVDFPKDKH